MIDDGGPAFPSQWENDGDGNATAPDGQLCPPRGTVILRGMSLRDYFAAKAMHALLISNLAGDLINRMTVNHYGSRDEWSGYSAISGEQGLFTDMQAMSGAAYEYADAMLKASQQ